MAETSDERTTRRELSRKLTLHRLPLDPDGTRRGEFLLPPDLTPEEAERFAAFVSAVALPD